MYDKLRRANAWQISEFIKIGAERIDEELPQDIEKAYFDADKKMYDFITKILRGDNNEEYFEYLDIFHELEQSCFVLGMKAGLKLAISFGLGDK